MASNIAPGLMEGQSDTRPPYFDGKDYNIWKNKMKAFIKSKDPLEWDIVQRGIRPRVVSSSKDEDIKKLVEYETISDADILKREALDAKAVYSLYCALSPSEYNRISSCETAKEIWDRLHVTYEGTDRVKETKIIILLQQYETFKMKPDESVTDMFSRFTDIVNGLAYLGQPVSDAMKVTKILRGCQRSGILSKHLFVRHRGSPLSLDELVGTLQSYEVERQNDEEDTKSKKALALKSNFDSDDSDSEDDEEIALMVKKFRKFRKMARKGKEVQGKPFRSSEQKKSFDDREENRDVVGFECKKR